jgi:nicotinamide-nucleotide amidase
MIIMSIISFMQALIRQIDKFLVKNSLTVSVAESCSGGLISRILTETPGSSRYFILGVVAYSNKAKEKILGIRHSLIVKNTAVSQEIAKEMAQNIRRLAKTDFGLGVTGIAGPTGAVPGKPIGTVFIAVSKKNKTSCERFLFSGKRSLVRKKAALASLRLLKKIML